MNRTLVSWLQWITEQQPGEIVLGLERVKVVAARLGLLKLPCPVITVGGTNGKGSTVAGLESIYRTAGYRVGAFTSPILFKHNEYIRIDGHAVVDEFFCEAYTKIAEAKGEVDLTPFEFHTIAALWMFAHSQLDVIILEVGLGGRLDAVNIIDADVSIVTSIAIDHANWLGDTREKIAYEKAGIFRQNKPAICGDRNPPQTLIDHANKIGAQLFCLGTEFNYVEGEGNWTLLYKTFSPCGRRWREATDEGAMQISHLPINSLYLPNMACVLMAITLLQSKLPVNDEVIASGLKNVKITGRVQIIPGEVTEIYDVSHNPAAVAHLAKRLQEMPTAGKTIAIFSMLADKDIAESIKQIASQIDEWHIAPLTVQRAATKEQLLKAFENIKTGKIYFHAMLSEAYRTAKSKSKAGDRLVIFGSFHTVSALINY